ncbi:MAG TPA: 50S ribosomal protein L28 [Bacteroidales bacterium]|nr:50S ribosomal protein L28 [Bacteroidales bacterium]HOE04988.1 50S ribosomal protein L28 [Bacteroidales bacterium]HQL70177.1 50S ribosomal protein L28 [Bacteroidales bacterium]
MARICQITGKTSIKGHNVSHANNRTNRRFEINLLEKKFYLQEEDRWVTLKVTPAGMRTINKKGLKSALDEAVKNGYIDKY